MLRFLVLPAAFLRLLKSWERINPLNQTRIFMFATAMLRIQCPQCGHRLKYEPDIAGKKAKCQKCNTSFRLPASEPEVAELIEPHSLTTGFEPIAEDPRTLEALRAEIMTAAIEFCRNDSNVMRMNGAGRIQELLRRTTLANQMIDQAEPGKKIFRAEQLLSAFKAGINGAKDANEAAITTWMWAGLFGLVVLMLGALIGLAEEGVIPEWVGFTAAIVLIVICFVFQLLR